MSVPQRHSLLVIEDDTELVDSFRYFFDSEIDLATAENPDEGVELLRQRDIHIILTNQGILLEEF